MSTQVLFGIGMAAMLAFFLFLALRQQKNVTSLLNYHLYGDDLSEKPVYWFANLYKCEFVRSICSYSILRLSLGTMGIFRSYGSSG